MDAHARGALLQQLCDLLPEHDATLIRAMSPDDPITYVEAYTTFRRTGVELPRPLRRQLLRALDSQIDAEELRRGRGRDPVGS
jgi:hypothetical protein